MKTTKKKSFLYESYNQNREIFTPIESLATTFGAILGVILLGWLTNFIIKTVMHYDIVKTLCGTLENKILLFFANLFVGIVLGIIEVIIITIIVFFIKAVYTIITKEIAIMRYCKLPLTEEEIRIGIKKNLYSNILEYFEFVNSQITYGFDKRRLKLSNEDCNVRIESCMQVFHLSRDEVLAKLELYNKRKSIEKYRKNNKISI